MENTNEKRVENDELESPEEALSRWFAELLDQTKKGLAFYAKGVRLFWNDIVFCLNLVSRAAQGYTLKPREVRTIRYVCFWILLLLVKIPVLTLCPADERSRMF